MFEQHLSHYVDMQARLSFIASTNRTISRLLENFSKLHEMVFDGTVRSAQEELKLIQTCGSILDGIEELGWTIAKV